MFATSSEYILKRSILDSKINSNSQVIKIGCELEFFLFGDHDEIFIDTLRDVLIGKFNIVYDLKKEQGDGQYEINIRESDDLSHLALTISRIRDFIIQYCKNHNLKADFQAKPIKDDCGSAMQFNISIHEGEKNLFFDLDNSNYKNVIGGLLNFSNEILFLSCEKEEEFLRFNLENNISLFKNKKYVAPTNYSYGIDNRTCLIRCLKNRLEYRLASASCDAFLILSALVYYIDLSLKEDIFFDKKRIYGNSFDDIYDTKILESYQAAKDTFLNGKLYQYLKTI